MTVMLSLVQMHSFLNVQIAVLIAPDVSEYDCVDMGLLSTD